MKSVPGISNGRTERLAAYLAANADESHTLATLRSATEPCATSKAIHTALKHMCRYGRATYTPGNRRGEGRYQHKHSEAAPKAFKTSTPKPKPEPTKAAPRRLEPIELRARPMPVARTVAIDSDGIAADVAAFIARGGRIEKLRTGASAYNEKPARGMKDENDAAWKIRQANQPALTD